MSKEIEARAWRTTVGSLSAKAVLVKLADNANDQGGCWPSMEHISEQCEMSVRSVRRALSLLERLGLVSRKMRGRYQTPWYTIHAENLAELTTKGDNVSARRGDNLSISEIQGGQIGPHERTQCPPEPSRTVSTCTPLPPEGEERESGHPLSELVDRLWEIAPKVSRKRSSKAKVLSALKRLRPAADEQERMVRWLRRRVREEDWSQGDGQFMPALDRVIRAKAWRDEPDEGAGAAGEEAGGRGEEWEDTSRLGPEVSLPEPAWDWWPAVQEISQETGIDLERGFSWYRLPREWQDAVMRSGPPESGESGKNAAA